MGIFVAKVIKKARARYVSSVREKGCSDNKG
jgi:hypothetical protein